MQKGIKDTSCQRVKEEEIKMKRKIIHTTICSGFLIEFPKLHIQKSELIASLTEVHSTQEK